MPAPASIPSRAADTALVLVNLGTPAAPTPRAVRRYLAEFLHDHRVVELTALAVVPAAALRDPAAAFAGGGARSTPRSGCPARRRLAAGRAHPAAGRRRCSASCRSCAWSTRCAMASPRWPACSHRCAHEGVRRVLVLPLYPQYSTTTTASVGDVLADETTGVQTRMVDDYHLDAGWVDAVAGSIRAHWHAQGPRRAPAVLLPRPARSGWSMPAIRMPRSARPARGDRAAAGPGRRRMDAELPVALRPRAVAAAVHRGHAARAGANAACARSTWSARASPWIAWRRWRKSR